MTGAVLPVNIGEQAYPIYIAEDALKTYLAEFQFFLEGRQVALICDEFIAANYLSEYLAFFPEVPILIIRLPSREETKSLLQFEAIIHQLIEHHFRRKDLLITIGGGIISDLTGFVAACYHRGIDYIQIPTTLLAQVDASIGGKTAINHPLGKNLIGAFHQPKAVFMSTHRLSSLPDRQFLSGLAEVIKYGLIADESLLSWLSASKLKILAKDAAYLQTLIYRCCEIKCRFVSDDERDEGIRQHLNFGHTFAHAIEIASQYTFLHGEAVSIGMAMATYLSWDFGFITEEAYLRVIDLLKAFYLPVVWPASISVNEAYALMLRDKKNTEKMPSLILLKQLGQAQRVPHVSLSCIERASRAVL
jgi:3-dehydroquinate synthase